MVRKTRAVWQPDWRGPIEYSPRDKPSQVTIRLDRNINDVFNVGPSWFLVGTAQKKSIMNTVNVCLHFPSIDAPTPAGISVIPEEPLPSEGVVKGGYPVDIAAQSTVDLTTIGQSDLGCSESLIEARLEPTGVTQMEMEFTVLGPPESYSETEDIPPCITEVIQPMEMAELVDILPTLSLIEEEAASGPVTPSVMDMLESFGLGVTQSNAVIQLEKSDNEATYLTPSEADYSSSGTDSQGLASSAGHATVKAMGNEVLHPSFEGPPEDTKDHKTSNIGLPVRNRVEWDRPSTSLSWLWHTPCLFLETTFFYSAECFIKGKIRVITNDEVICPLTTL